MISGALTSPKRTCGRSAPEKFLPRIRNSPPGIAAAGETSRICGRASLGLRNAIKCEGLIKIEPSSGEQYKRAVHARHHVIRHDAKTAGQSFQLPHRPGLPDVEQPEQNETQHP